MVAPPGPPFVAPPGACDCHLHIYDERFALAPTALGVPRPAPVDAYRAARDALGIVRSVIVQPTAYGADNACTLDAIAALGPSARGVAMVTADVGDDELARLTAGGIRGFRMRAFPAGVLGFDDLERTAARAHAYGWHVDLEMDGRLLAEREAMLARLPGRIVVDHIGKFMQPVALDHPGVAALLRLIARGRTYVKLTAPYDSSRTGPPDWADLAPLVRHLVRLAPERLVWASNWPHVTLPPDERPDDTAWLTRLADWVPDVDTRRRILVDTPAELYGFDP